MSEPLRVLLTVPQFALDPASGAARTVTTICEMLAVAGFQVRAIGTTSSEGEMEFDVDRFLAALGIQAECPEGEICFDFRGVTHISVREGATPDDTSAAIDAVFKRELSQFRPHVLFTYGGMVDDLRRQQCARESDCKVVFGLFNAGYHSAESFRYADAIVTPSEFLSRFYYDRMALKSTPLATPLHLADVIARDHLAARVTFVNPTIGKGVMLVARLADELAQQAPDIPFGVIESRGACRLLLQAGFAGGFDLRDHRNLIFRATVPSPREVFRYTRALIVPSVVEEASARVVAEALVNGIPVVASERGGLPENCGQGGIIHALPAGLTVRTRRPVEPEAVGPWVSSLLSWFRDDGAYARACERALLAGARFDPECVGPMYVRYFEAVGRANLPPLNFSFVC